MEKIKKRNELSIFEELRIKPPTSARTPEHYPNEHSLHKLNVLCKVDKNNNPISWWKKRKNGELMQVNELGIPIFSGDEKLEKKIPKESALKKNMSKILVTLHYKYKWPVSWWTKDNKGQLIQLNIQEKEKGLDFQFKSWLRDKAIETVGHEIRSMKKKAYEYSKDELLEMINAEENKLIKSGGLKALKVAFFASIGLSWVPFI